MAQEAARLEAWDAPRKPVAQLARRPYLEQGTEEVQAKEASMMTARELEAKMNADLEFARRMFEVAEREAAWLVCLPTCPP